MQQIMNIDNKTIHQVDNYINQPCNPVAGPSIGHVVRFPSQSNTPAIERRLYDPFDSGSDEEKDVTDARVVVSETFYYNYNCFYLNEIFHISIQQLFQGHSSTAGEECTWWW
jgi:hypothetical protein